MKGFDVSQLFRIVQVEAVSQKEQCLLESVCMCLCVFTCMRASHKVPACPRGDLAFRASETQKV